MADEQTTVGVKLQAEWVGLDKTMEDLYKKVKATFDTLQSYSDQIPEKSKGRYNRIQAQMGALNPKDEKFLSNSGKVTSEMSQLFLTLTGSLSSMDKTIPLLGQNIADLNKIIISINESVKSLSRFIGQTKDGINQLTGSGFLHAVTKQANGKKDERNWTPIYNIKTGNPYGSLSQTTAASEYKKYLADNSYISKLGPNDQKTWIAGMSYGSKLSKEDSKAIATDIANQMAALSKEGKAYGNEVELLQQKLEKAKLNVDHADIQKAYIESTSLQSEISAKREQILEKETKENTVQSNKEVQIDENSTPQIQKLNDSVEKQPTLIGKAVKSFISYRIILTTLKKVVSEAINTITDLDKALTNQAVVSTLTRKETWALVSSYEKLAKQTGFTTTEIANVATKYFQQGKTVSEVLTLTKAAAESAKVAGIEATQAVDYLTTAINGFKLSASDAMAVSDKFAALAASSATSYDELAVALSKVASQANLAGMSMDYTLGLIAKGIETTREPAESIGTALKTVIARMREITDYGQTLEDGVDINNVEKQLAYVNIALRDSSGQLRSTEDVLDELGKKWEDLTDTQQAAIAKALAGTRQQSRLIAMMEDYDRTLQLVEISSNSLGATQAQEVEYLQGMEASVNKLKTAYQGLINQITNSDAVIGAVSTVAQIIKDITNMFSGTKAIATWTAIISLATSFITKQIPNLIVKLNNIALQISQNKQKEIEVLNAVKSQNKALLVQLGLKKQIAGVTSNSVLFSNTNYRTNGTQLVQSNSNVSSDYTFSNSASSYSDFAKTGFNSKSTLGNDKYYTFSSDNFGSKVSGWTNKLGAIMQAISGIAMIVEAIVSITEKIKNAAKDQAAKNIEEANKIQSEIYTNTHLKSTLKNLDEQFDILNSKIIKTNEDLQDMEDIRKNYIEALKTSDSDMTYNNMSVADLRRASENKQADLTKETNKKVDELGDTLLKVNQKSDFDWSTVATITAGMTAVGGAAGSLAGPLGTLLGTIGGAGGGFLTGITTAWIQKAITDKEINDAKKIIHEELQTDEGVSQFKYLIEANMNTSDMTSKSGKEEASRINSLYASLINGLSADQLEELTTSGKTLQEIADEFKNMCTSMSSDVKVLEDESSTYTDQLKSLHKILSRLDQINPELAAEMKEQYSVLLDFEKNFSPESIALIDKYGWNIDNLNDLLGDIIESGVTTADAAVSAIAKLISGGESVEDFLKETSNWTSDMLEDAAKIIENGKSLSDVADNETKGRSSVSSIRTKQGKWSSMTASEKQDFMSSNSGLFNTNGKFDKSKFDTFVNGGDITEMITDYMKSTQDTLISEYANTIKADKVRIEALRKELETTTDEDQKTLIKNQIASYEAEIASAMALSDEIPTMFDLTIDEVVSKQKEQISAYKEMLQKQEKDLEESLTKRKQAYQDYYSDINDSQELADYEKNRDNFYDQIAKFSGATDATSVSKVVELRKSLKSLEEERIKTERTNAQQAVLESIDDELDKLKDTYNDLIDSNKDLLAALNSNTYSQYLTYLKESGASDAEIAQWIQNHPNTFFDTVTSGAVDKVYQSQSTPTVEGQSSSQSSTTNLTINGQSYAADSTLQSLVKQLLVYVNNKSGSNTGYGG